MRIARRGLAVGLVGIVVLVLATVASRSASACRGCCDTKGIPKMRRITTMLIALVLAALAGSTLQARIAFQIAPTTASSFTCPTGRIASVSVRP